MIGLFQELGPCGVDSNGEPYNNPYSWSNVSNMVGSHARDIPCTQTDTSDSSLSTSRQQLECPTLSPSRDTRTTMASLSSFQTRHAPIMLRPMVLVARTPSQISPWCLTPPRVLRPTCGRLSKASWARSPTTPEVASASPRRVTEVITARSLMVRLIAVFCGVPHRC
jgi:hypothetical protein